MIVKVKKLWLGHASVRDYIVQDCIKKHEDLIIEFQGDSRRFPSRSLKGYLSNSMKEEFKSKFTGENYQLIDFPWEPVKQVP